MAESIWACASLHGGMQMAMKRGGRSTDPRGSTPSMAGGVILLLLEGGPDVMKWDGAWLGRSIDPYSGLWALLSCGVLGPLSWWSVGSVEVLSHWFPFLWAHGSMWLDLPPLRRNTSCIQGWGLTLETFTWIMVTLEGWCALVDRGQSTPLGGSRGSYYSIWQCPSWKSSNIGGNSYSIKYAYDMLIFLLI
jgi:hypothetical protein